MYLCGQMSGQEHLSPKQFKVFRGVEFAGGPQFPKRPGDWDDKAMGNWDERVAQENRDRSKQNSISQPLGVHWSSEHAVARDFATGDGLASYKASSSSGHGAVIHATVNRTAIHPMNREGDHDDYGIAADQDEAEVPLKYGAKVSVHAITKITDKRERTRNFNPPREMKA